MRNRRYARECLAAEPETRNVFEIIKAGDLTRCMARDGERQFFPGNTATVIAHTDQLYPALAQLDLDQFRAGVETVLHQLLQYRGGSLDDLAGGDLIDQLRR